MSFESLRFLYVGVIFSSCTFSFVLLFDTKADGLVGPTNLPSQVTTVLHKDTWRSNSYLIVERLHVKS